MPGRPIEHIARKQPTARTKFNQLQPGRRIEGSPHFFELSRQQAAEHGVNIARGIEISSLTELLTAARVVAQLRLVETQLHVTRKRNRPVAADLIGNALAQKR